MHVESDPVPGAVAEEAVHVVERERLSHGPVHVPARDPVADDLARLRLSFEHLLVKGHLPGLGRPPHERAREIATVAVHARPEVDEEEIAGLDAPVRGCRVGKRGAFSRRDDGVERERIGAPAAEFHLECGGDLAFARTGRPVHGRQQPVERTLGHRDRSFDGVHFVAGLHLPQRPDEVAERDEGDIGEHAAERLVVGDREALGLERDGAPGVRRQLGDATDPPLAAYMGADRIRYLDVYLLLVAKVRDEHGRTLEGEPQGSGGAREPAKVADAGSGGHEDRPVPGGFRRRIEPKAPGSRRRHSASASALPRRCWMSASRPNR